MRSWILLIALLPLSLAGQELKIKKTRGGIISLGGRSALSFFNDGSWKDFGTGVGGQIRVQVSDRVNTDWYFDYLTGNVGSYAHRTDYHIGWSVLFYLKDPGPEPSFFQPYVLTGHCFDNSQQEANTDPTIHAQRLSSAIHAGLGAHFNLDDRFDISAVVQYMVHLGTDIHSEFNNGEVEFVKAQGASLEGHLLFHISFNYKIIDAW